jgi:hypothetical protein
MSQMFLRIGTLGLALLICAGCGGQPAPPPGAATASPTIAAVQRSPTPAGAPARPSPSPANPAAQATAIATAAPPATPAAGQAPAPEPSIYLWPAELPAGLAVSPAESRVSAEGEAGPTGMGFYIVTLNAGAKKLVIGGGDLADALPLAGAERQVTVGQRTAKLIASGEQRELLIDVSRGKLFVYGLNLSEDELLRVAASLQPIDVRDLRALAAKK